MSDAHKYSHYKGKLSAEHVENLIRMFARDGDANSSQMVRMYFIHGKGYKEIATALKTTRMNVYNQVGYFARKCPILDNSLK